jgi:hypothetical protein
MDTIIFVLLFLSVICVLFLLKEVFFATKKDIKSVDRIPSGRAGYNPGTRTTSKELKLNDIIAKRRYFDVSDITDFDPIKKLMLKGYIKGYKYVFYKGYKIEVPEVWK